MSEKRIDDKLEKLANLAPRRRELLKRVLAVGFATPVVAAFALNALTAESAHAQGGNAAPEIEGKSAGAAIALVTGAALIARDRLK